MQKRISIVFLIGYYAAMLAAQKPIFLLDPCPPHTDSKDCDEKKIVVGPGFGQLVNGKREGLWHESYCGKPYAKGDYNNGKREGLWIFYCIEEKRLATDTTIESNVKKFVKAEILSEVTFKHGKLNGEYRWYSGSKLSMVANYKNDSLVDSLKQFDKKGRLIYSADYNKTYYDSAWSDLWGDYLEARLPYCTYFQFINKNDYFRFEGYKNEDNYLVYDEKAGNFMRERFLIDYYFNEKAEGKYQMYYKGELSGAFEVKEGRKIRVIK